MAWRIDEQLVRGELDNRERGCVTGRLWFVGRAAPVELNLTGDAWRDLAGRRLTIVNPRPKEGLPDALDDRQTGDVGDITASRKVKVLDVSVEEMLARTERGEPSPWHWGNALYLEWYSETQGRIVIESADYQLTIDPEATWNMTIEEETAQRQRNAEASARFLDALKAAVADPFGEGEEEPSFRPLTEAEAERLQADSDQLNDRVQARLEREGPGADIARIIEEEMARARRERGEPEPTPEEAAEQRKWLDALHEAAADESDPDAVTELGHPLAERARVLAQEVMSHLDEQDCLPQGAGPEHPVMELRFSVIKAGAKFAGALAGREWPPSLAFSATTIVWLKRAISYLEDARAAAEACQVQRLVAHEWLSGVVGRIEEQMEEAGGLVAELRAKLERGFD